MTLYYRSLTEVAGQLASGELSARALTEAQLARIAALEGQLHSYAMVLGERALAEAESRDAALAAGESPGPLHGVPVAIKDLFYTRGLVTACGTRVLRHFIPDEDATVVRRLAAAGAVIIGKTQLTEGAFGEHHPDIEPPRNPWNAEHWPGVSSSGSGVAVAAGLAFGALGTDTGGSIRFPAACCGLVGVKPTYGRVSRHGAFPLAESLDHIGPMTRSVDDAARLLHVLAGADPLDPTSLQEPVPDYLRPVRLTLAGVRVGIDWRYVTEGVEPLVVQTLEQTVALLQEAGAVIGDVQMPAATRVLVQNWGLTCGVECARAHAAYYPRRQAEYGPVLAGLIEVGRQTANSDYQALERLRRQFRKDLEARFGEFDILLMPAMPVQPPSLAEMRGAVSDQVQRADFITFTAPFDYSGHPTLTLPTGLAANGLPRAVQLVGPWLAERDLLDIGRLLEKQLGPMPHPPAYP